MQALEDLVSLLVFQRRVVAPLGLAGGDTCLLFPWSAYDRFKWFAGYRYCRSTHLSGECFVAPEDLCTVVEGRRVVHLGAKTRDMQ